MGVADFIKNLFFPQTCLSCGKKPENSDAPLCKNCRTDYEKSKYTLCVHCRKYHCRCSCLPSVHASDVFLYLSVFPYKENSAGGRMLLTLKNRKDRRALKLLSKDMAISLQKGCILKGDALVTYVPRSNKAILEYGIDQAKELAKAVAVECNLPLMPLLVRKEIEGSQKERNIEDRIAFAEKSYQLAENLPCPANRQIILVDDILTSGATLTACARILKSAGATQIICLTAGRTAKTKSYKNV